MLRQNRRWMGIVILMVSIEGAAAESSGFHLDVCPGTLSGDDRYL
jgi:hypothetical protein